MTVRYETNTPALTEMAELYAALRGPRGSFTYLCCMGDGRLFWAHHPVGRVLYHW
jgi:hypothetical protein